MNEKDIIGTGWSFPPRFEVANGEGFVEMVSEETEIKEALSIMISTVRGERYLRPKFGIDLRDYPFTPITTALKRDIEDMITQSIAEYEPRIIVEKVTVDDSDSLEGMLAIYVSYTVRSTNSKDNLVYPLYL